MPFLGKMCGRIRRVEPPIMPENKEMEQFHLAGCGSELIVEALPSRASLVAEGNSWGTFNTTGISAGSTLPTTNGYITLFNQEPDNGKIYVIDMLSIAKVLVDTVVGDMIVLAQIVRPYTNTVLNNITSRYSCSGKANYDGKAAVGNSAFTLANMWDIIGGITNLPSAVAGACWQTLQFDLFGKYIILPKFGITFYFSTVTATTAAMRVYLQWHEVQIPYVQ